MLYNRRLQKLQSELIEKQERQLAKIAENTQPDGAAKKLTIKANKLGLIGIIIGFLGLITSAYLGCQANELSKNSLELAKATDSTEQRIERMDSLINGIRELSVRQQSSIDTLSQILNQQEISNQNMGNQLELAGKSVFQQLLLLSTSNKALLYAINGAKKDSIRNQILIEQALQASLDTLAKWKTRDIPNGRVINDGQYSRTLEVAKEVKAILGTQLFNNNILLDDSLKKKWFSNYQAIKQVNFIREIYDGENREKLFEDVNGIFYSLYDLQVYLMMRQQDRR